jgi:hypothetical protein
MIARNIFAQCVAVFDDGTLWLIYDAHQSDDYNTQLLNALAEEAERRKCCREPDSVMIRSRRERDRSVINPLVWDAMFNDAT